MSTVSTHVLDAVSGTPAADVPVVLLVVVVGDGGEHRLGEARTDGDGRVKTLAPDGVGPGVYRLVVDTSAYFTASGQRGFYPEVTITFTVDDERHYHVPLLLSPYAYSTYRGS